MSSDEQSAAQAYQSVELPTHYIAEVDGCILPKLSHHFNLHLAEQYLDGKAHLDVGCWNGMFLSLSNAVTSMSVGLDLAFPPLQAARQTLEDSVFTNGNVLCLPFSSEEFDVITMWEVIEHLPASSELEALRELNRVLRPGGYLLLSTPNNHPLGILLDPAYFLTGHRHYPQSVIEDLLHRSGFNVVEVHHSTGLITMLDGNLALVFKHLLGQQSPQFAAVDRLKAREYVPDRSRRFSFRMHIVACKGGQV